MVNIVITRQTEVFEKFQIFLLVLPEFCIIKDLILCTKFGELLISIQPLHSFDKCYGNKPFSDTGEKEKKQSHFPHKSLEENDGRQEI